MTTRVYCLCRGIMLYFKKQEAKRQEARQMQEKWNESNKSKIILLLASKIPASKKERVWLNMTLKDKLYKLRRDKGYSQEELAEKLDVSRQAVSKWERGESSPDTNNLIRIAKLYDIPVDELAGCIRGDASLPLESAAGKTSSGISLKKPACAENMGIAGDFISLSVPEDDGEIYPKREPVQADAVEPLPYTPQSSGTAFESSGDTGGIQRK